MKKSTEKTIKVLIVNDSNVLFSVIQATVETQQDLKVIAHATNGQEAITQVKRHLPDLVLMDIHMPVMDGVEATQKIISFRPKTRILITSATITRNMRHIFEAIHYGAVDYVRSPSLAFAPGTPVTRDQLLQAGKPTLDKIRTSLKVTDSKLTQQNSNRTAREAVISPVKADVHIKNAPHLLAIGCSTGGPTAVATLLQRLYRPFPAPIIICLHHDAEFTQGFVSWLGDYVGLPCSIARDGEQTSNNHIYIAPGGKNNLEIAPNQKFRITPPQQGQYFFPNIDHLFTSIANNFIYKACGVVMSGMGDDGAEGVLKLQQKGSIALAQDEQSAAVDSMPRAARMAAQLDRGYPPAQLATQINGYF